MDWISGLEIVGTLAAFGALYLAGRQNILNWPAWIISILIYLYIFADAALYGDAALQVFYLGMTIYGWAQWRRGEATPSKEHPITVCTMPCRIGAILTTAIVTPAMGWVLSHTRSNVPYWDAFTTTAALVATYLMARKKIDHWIWWIIIDSVAAAIYVYKGLYVTAFQYAVFVPMAIWGWIQWSQHRRIQST